MTLLWIAVGLVGFVVIAGFFQMYSVAKDRRSGLLPAAGQATTADVERLVRDGYPILAIRCYREIHHVGLAEAKKAVDEFHSTLS